MQQHQRQQPVKQDSNRNFYETEYDDAAWEPPPSRTSARRYQGDVRAQTSRTQADVQTLAQRGELPFYSERSGPIPPRHSATQMNMPGVRRQAANPVETEDIDSRRTSTRLVRGGGRVRFHWLFFVGLAMLVMLLGWVLLTTLFNWWQLWQDDLHYGRPRTFQTEAVVGHNDSEANPSHFVAINLHRQIEIIEFPGGDSSKAKIYIGPVLIGEGQDLAAVTLSFKDMNGDGKPDMIVNIQNNRFVFINDNGSFRPTRPGENVQL